MENVLDQYGDACCLNSPEFIDHHPIIYWNLVSIFLFDSFPISSYAFKVQQSLMQCSLFLWLVHLVNMVCVCVLSSYKLKKAKTTGFKFLCGLVDCFEDIALAYVAYLLCVTHLSVMLNISWPLLVPCQVWYFRRLNVPTHMPGFILTAKCVNQSMAVISLFDYFVVVGCCIVG